MDLWNCCPLIFRIFAVSAGPTSILGPQYLPRTNLSIGKVTYVSLKQTHLYHLNSQKVVISDVSPDILLSGFIPSSSKIPRAVLERMYASNYKQSPQSISDDFILFIFLPDPIFSSRITPSEAIFHRDSGSVYIK